MKNLLLLAFDFKYNKIPSFRSGAGQGVQKNVHVPKNCELQAEGKLNLKD